MAGPDSDKAPRKGKDERRKYARVDAHLLATTKEQATGNTGYGRITRVSLSGVYILTTDPSPPRQKVFVEFKLPGSHATLAAETVVRSVHPGEGMGVEFESLTAEQEQDLKEYIQRENA